MKLDTPQEIEQICYTFKLADYPRAANRALVDNLFNGVPPYSAEDVEANNIAINVNFLGGTSIAHDARMQFYRNFLKPGRYFSASTDMGPKHKRTQRSAVVTSALAKIMKRSLVYYETFRSKFALDVLHGVGPASWEDEDVWCPDARGMCDVLIPSNTLLTMKNLPFFAVYRSFSGPELAKLTRNRKAAAAAGWNMKLVDACLAYVDRNAFELYNQNWPEVWSPEKQVERVKGDGGYYAGDQVPTIDCFDFYFWDDDDKTQGWKRRIILDSWSTPTADAKYMAWKTEVDFARNQFLFTSHGRKVASSWREIVSFQFADLSAVSPFQYHSVRSLGWLLYSVINLQNRMRCKFNEAIFEALMMYFRVKNMDDAERALKLNLINHGLVDETMEFIPAKDRFQVNAELVQLGLRDLESIINSHSAPYTQSPDQMSGNVEKTKFQYMAEIQSVTSMVSAALQQAYAYQTFEYREILRRFFRKDSKDPDVNEFRAKVQSQDVPAYMLVPEAWDVEPERVMGSGNKTLEMLIAQQLMEFRNLYDPEPQRQILRDFTLAVTDDPGRTESMVPTEPTRITDSVYTAQLAAGALLQNLPVAVKTGINHIEYVDTMLVSLEVELGRINKNGGVPPVDKLEGLDAMVQHIEQHIAIVAQDPNEKERVVAWQKRITKYANLMRAYAQRIVEQAKKAAQNGNGGMDPKDMAKLQAIQITAAAKAKNTRESHAQRTAQRQIQFEMEQRQKQQQHQLDMMIEAQRAGIDLNALRAERLIDINAEKEKQRIRGEEG